MAEGKFDSICSVKKNMFYNYIECNFRLVLRFSSIAHFVRGKFVYQISCVTDNLSKYEVKPITALKMLFAIRELKQVTFVSHGRKLEVNISYVRRVVFPRFSN